MADIGISRKDDERFHVTVREGDRRTEHDVTLSTADYERLGGAYDSADDFIRACFEFLLEREPKESILRSFDVTAISRYFPEFEAAIRASDDRTTPNERPA